MPIHRTYMAKHRIEALSHTNPPYLRALSLTNPLLPGALSLDAAGVVLHVALPDAGLALLSFGLELEVLLVGELAAAPQLAVQQLVLHLLVILAGQVAPAQQVRSAGHS